MRLSVKSERAWRQFKESVTQAGGVVVETDWLGSAEPHRIRCLAGHRAEPTPNAVQRGQGVCWTCSGSNPQAAWNEFKTNVRKQGGKVVESRWLGKDKRHNAICAKGHVCRPRPGYVRDGGGICRVCSRNDPATAHAEFLANVARAGGQVVEEQWLGKAAPHRVMCLNGHEYTPTPKNMRVGSGYCRTCVGNDPETAYRNFKARVEELGGEVLEPTWLGVGEPHEVICREGHLGKPYPTAVQQGQGICRWCKGKTWDAFYVVQNPEIATVKFGITSGMTRPRLRFHATQGFATVLRAVSGLPNDAAPELERGILAALKEAGVHPVRGREYFPLSATDLILTLVDRRLTELGFTNG
ncbi:hypothetical protein [Streptomyces sp. SID3343]|uniref:hypothetical protein n=1 Tax=Streptomyces sp. SID3343 TaxID=2690260 RepID=UPI00136D6D89|nr:hypothetical protein [Streptomyces sp. SID3343]MYW04445.1 hypothetical protein [Streptomyces sp. SID3343]